MVNTLSKQLEYFGFLYSFTTKNDPETGPAGGRESQSCAWNAAFKTVKHGLAGLFAAALVVKRTAAGSDARRRYPFSLFDLLSLLSDTPESKSCVAFFSWLW